MKKTTIILMIGILTAFWKISENYAYAVKIILRKDNQKEMLEKIPLEELCKAAARLKDSTLDSEHTKAESQPLSMLKDLNEIFKKTRPIEVEHRTYREQKEREPDEFDRILRKIDEIVETLPPLDIRLLPQTPDLKLPHNNTR